MLDRTTLLVNDRVVNALTQCMAQGDFGLKTFPGILRKAMAKDSWRDRIVHQTKQRVEFKTFREFMETLPPEGLGTDERTLKNLCRDDIEASDLIDRALQGKPGGDKRSESAITVDNVNNDQRPTGNSRNAALRRLRKDAPALHARVLAGDLSAHAAMIEAGFRKKPTALERLRKAWAGATDEERDEFLASI